MEVMFAGTGSAFTKTNWHTNAVVTFDNGYRLLIDCGSDIRHSLRELGLTHRDINGVYISHLHGDHAGGLEWLGFVTRFDPACNKPDLYISKILVNDLWARTLSGGMASLQNEINTLESYFEVHAIDKNGGFVIDGTFFNLIQVIHIMNGFAMENSFGLMVLTKANRKIFFTTDTQFCPAQIMDFYKSATHIFHDCECTPFKSGVHAHYDDLKTLSPDIKAKMHLVHYQDNVDAEWHTKATQDGFIGGFVPKGKIYEF